MNSNFSKIYPKQSGFVAIALVLIFSIFTFAILLIENAYPEIYEKYAINQKNRFIKEYQYKSNKEIMKIKSMNFK